MQYICRNPQIKRCCPQWFSFRDRSLLVVELLCEAQQEITEGGTGLMRVALRRAAGLGRFLVTEEGASLLLQTTLERYSYNQFTTTSLYVMSLKLSLLSFRCWSSEF